jgi:hypothetical protein
MNSINIILLILVVILIIIVATIASLHKRSRNRTTNVLYVEATIVPSTTAPDKPVPAPGVSGSCEQCAHAECAHRECTTCIQGGCPFCGHALSDDGRDVVAASVRVDAEKIYVSG